jgi:hypothetical protein
LDRDDVALIDQHFDLLARKKLEQPFEHPPAEAVLDALRTGAQLRAKRAATVERSQIVVIGRPGAGDGMPEADRYLGVGKRPRQPLLRMQGAIGRREVADDRLAPMVIEIPFVEGESFVVVRAVEEMRPLRADQAEAWILQQQEVQRRASRLALADMQIVGKHYPRSRLTIKNSPLTFCWLEWKERPVAPTRIRV